MGNYEELKQAVSDVIKTNGNQEITGALLQQSLLAMVNSLGANYQLVGVAIPSTNPGTPDQNVAYLAGPGTYPNFNNAVVSDGYLGLLKYNGSWSLQTVAVGKDYTNDLTMIGATIGNFYENTGGVRKDKGNNISSTLFKRTTYIPINHYGSIKICGYDGGSSYNYTICAFYDENKTFISAYPVTNAGFQTIIIPPTDIPANAAFIRSCTMEENEQESYILCNIDKYLMDKLSELETLVMSFDSNINRLLLSQYGIIQNVKVSNVANSRIEQFVACTGIVRFRVSLISGTPEYSSFYVWAGTESSHLGKVQVAHGQFDKIYTVIVPNNYTGLTFRTGISASVGTVSIEILNEISDEAQISEIDSHKTVSTVYNIFTTTNSNSRINTFFPCSGTLRITVKNVYGTPSGQYYWLFYGTQSAPQTKLARSSTVIGESTTVFVPDDSGFTGITVFTVGLDPSNTTYNIIIEQLDTPEEKKVHNERIVCFGDSITQFNGQNSVGQGVNRDGMRYSDYMQILRPGIKLTNVGIGGTRLAQRTATLQSTPSNKSYAYAALDIVNLVGAICSGDFTYQDSAAEYISEQAVIARAKTVDITKVDIVTIFGGTNDWASNQDLGTVDDADKTTTLGALNNIITTLLTANPRLKIYIITPPVRYFGSTHTSEYWCDRYKNGNQQTLLELCESIESVANKNYMPVIDMHRNLGWNETNFWEFFVTPDGTHPYKGFGWIAQKIIQSIF